MAHLHRPLQLLLRRKCRKPRRWTRVRSPHETAGVQAIIGMPPAAKPQHMWQPANLHVTEQAPKLFKSTRCERNSPETHILHAHGDAGGAPQVHRLGCVERDWLAVVRHVAGAPLVCHLPAHLARVDRLQDVQEAETINFITRRINLCWRAQPSCVTSPCTSHVARLQQTIQKVNKVPQTLLARHFLAHLAHVDRLL